MRGSPLADPELEECLRLRPFWLLTNTLPFVLGFTVDSIAAVVDLLNPASLPPWLESALVVILSLAGLGITVLLQRRYEHAD